MNVGTLKPDNLADCGGFNTPVSGPKKKTIIRKKKRPVSFERRFLSACGSDAGTLEIAMVWRDTVLSVIQYKPQNNAVITVGSGKKCTYQTEVPGGKDIPIVRYCSDHWEIMFNLAFDGFVLRGDTKTEFKDASTMEFQVPSVQGNLDPGSLACKVDGSVRAKFQFGEVSILIHYVDSVAVAQPVAGGVKLSDFAGLIASLVIHFALFSVIFFTTDRVNALMVDRIITTSRFATTIEEVAVEDINQDKPDEVKPIDEQPDDTQKVEEDSNPSHFASVSPSDSVTPSNGQTMGLGAAEAAAMNHGLLTGANTMNSMLAAGLDVSNLDNIDLLSFDSAVAAAVNGYGLDATGTKGGGNAFGTYGNGGFGPDGVARQGQGMAIKAEIGPINIPPKKRAVPPVTPGKPDVSGSLDRIIIQKTVRNHIGELQACYERELTKIKGLKGRVVVTWLIDPHGNVTSAIVTETSMKNQNVENCVTNNIKHWRFPSPKGGGMVKIEYPFMFEVSSK